MRRKIQEHAAADFNAELVHRNLLDFQKVFQALTAQEQAQAMQCMVKQVVAHPDKLVLEIYELADFQAGSTEDPKWLRGLSGLRTLRFQVPRTTTKTARLA